MHQTDSKFPLFTQLAQYPQLMILSDNSLQMPLNKTKRKLCLLLILQVLTGFELSSFELDLNDRPLSRQSDSQYDDQVEQFLKVIGYKFQYKSSPNIRINILKNITLFTKNCCGYFLGYFRQLYGGTVASGQTGFKVNNDLDQL